MSEVKQFILVWLGVIALGLLCDTIIGYLIAVHPAISVIVLLPISFMMRKTLKRLFKRIFNALFKFPCSISELAK